MKIVALDIGGTSIKSGLWVDGELTDYRETETKASLGAAFVMKNAIEIIKAYDEFDRIGISTAGQVDPELGVIRYANTNLPGYTGTNIREIMENEFHVLVSVENDVNCAALGEAKFGVGRDYNDFLCITYGTGVGGAIIVDNKIYPGSKCSAGEFGSIITHAECRNEEDLLSGCYERYASTTALVRAAMSFDQTLTSGRTIFERISEPKIKLIVDNWICEIVYGLSSLIHIFNPTCIVLGGGILDQKYVLDRLDELIYTNIMESFRNVVLQRAQLGNQAGLYGAISCAQSL